VPPPPCGATSDDDDDDDGARARRATNARYAPQHATTRGRRGRAVVVRPIPRSCVDPRLPVVGCLWLPVLTPLPVFACVECDYLAFPDLLPREQVLTVLNQVRQTDRP
jgi:hypothetical protein